MSIITVGIDLAKNVFAVHGVNETGRPERVKPFVAPYRLSGKRGKNDAADAAAICEGNPQAQLVGGPSRRNCWSARGDS